MRVVGSGDNARLLPVPGHPTTTYDRAGTSCACIAAGVGRVGYFFFLISSGRMGYFFYLVYPIILSNASSAGRRLDILKYCGLGRYNPAVIVTYFRRRAR